MEELERDIGAPYESQLFHWIEPASYFKPKDDKAASLLKGLVFRICRIVYLLFFHAWNSLVTGLVFLFYFRKGLSFEDCRIGRSLAKSFKTYGIDLVWAVQYPWIKAGLVGANLSGIGIVGEELSYYRPDNRKKSIVRKEARLFKSLDSYLVASTSFSKYAESVYSIKPYAMSLASRFGHVDSISPTEDDLRCLVFGTISKYRCFEQILDALVLFRDEAAPRKVFIDFVGEACDDDNQSFNQERLRVAYKEKIVSRGLEAFVQILDPVPLDDRVGLPKRYDVGFLFFDVPGGIDYLNAEPTRLWTYMGSGLALLGMNTPGLRTYIVKAQAGIVVDGFSPESIADGLRRFVALTNEEIDKFKSNSLRVAVERSWEMQKPHFLQLFTKAL